MLKPTKEEGAMATQAGLGDTIRRSICFQAVLGFFFNKGVRGGPRVLLNLAAVLVGLFIVAKMLPSRMTEGALHAIPLPKTVWSGLNVEGKSRPGGLRIVVFGELDIGTPVGADQEGGGDAKSWTEMLCDQLECEMHTTMVPPPDTSPWSMSSNELYAQGIEKVFEDAEGKEGPGQDYSYLATSYPPQWNSGDLKEQIDKFLAMPKGRTPHSTLWVFSFGFWDVWSLSALPVAKAKESVDTMTRDVFEQVERLYTASLDPTSIAHSDVNTLTKSASKTLHDADKSVEQASADNQTGLQGGAPVKEQQAAPQTSAVPLATIEEVAAVEEQRPKDVDTFQILIPRVVDPSLLPGWRDLRPQIPSAHSKAEQMRNSAMLTVEWNDRIADRMVDWVKKAEAGQKDDEAGEDKENKEDKEDTEDTEDTENPSATAHIDNAGDRPAGPIRDGFAYNLADFVIDRILERQMLNAHLKDSNGRGDGEMDQGYRDVRNACLQPVGAARLAAPAAAAAAVPGTKPAVGDVLLNIPNTKTENDKQTPEESSARGSSSLMKKRAEFEDKAGLAYLSTAKICAIPDDHLFYTPFALSQRAIRGITNETVEMIRNGESVRTKLGKSKA